jgi:hypothetical protein
MDEVLFPAGKAGPPLAFEPLSKLNGWLNKQ